MHPSEGDLRGYCDNELSPATIAHLQDHIENCPKCQKRIAVLRARSDQTQIALAALDPTPAEAATPVRNAWFQLDTYITTKEKIPMLKKIFTPRARLAWAAVILVTIVAVSLSLPPVRAFANNFLGVFRVQQVSVVSFDPLNLPQNFNVDKTSIMQLFANSLKYDTIGKAQDVASAAEASNLANIPVRLPTSLSETPKITVQPGTNLSFKVDLARIQAILSDAGFKNVQLPKSLDGATVNAQLPMIVTATYGNMQLPGQDSSQGQGLDHSHSWCANCVVLVQLSSPTIQTPDGVDLTAIGTAYLRLTGMSAADAQSFSQTVDWATTLVIPVPSFASHQTVSVDGVNGVLIQQSPDNGGQYLLIWVKDGIVYGLTGYGSSQSALDIANSLK